MSPMMNDNIMRAFVKFGETAQTNLAALKPPDRHWETAFSGSSRRATKPETSKKLPYQKVKEEPERPVFNRYRALIDNE